jgi:hypothetical protein
VSASSPGDLSVQPFGEVAPPPARGAGASATGARAAGIFFLVSAGYRFYELMLSSAPLEAPHAPPMGVPTAGVAAGRGLDDDSSSSHSIALLEEQELE